MGPQPTATSAGPDSNLDQDLRHCPAAVDWPFPLHQGAGMLSWANTGKLQDTDPPLTPWFLQAMFKKPMACRTFIQAFISSRDLCRVGTQALENRPSATLLQLERRGQLTSLPGLQFQCPLLPGDQKGVGEFCIIQCPDLKTQRGKQA